MPNNLSREETKDALKEALTAWLDDKLAELGRWTLKGIGALALAGLVWLFLVSSGWHKGP